MDTGEEISVALSYDRLKGEVPTVTARGRAAIARQIESLAEAHGVPDLRDPDLARALVVLDPKSPIPVAAFAAVAEILAYLFNLSRQSSGQQAPAGTRP